MTTIVFDPEELRDSLEDLADVERRIRSCRTKSAAAAIVAELYGLGFNAALDAIGDPEEQRQEDEFQASLNTLLPHPERRVWGGAA